MPVNCYPDAAQEAAWAAYREDCHRRHRAARMKKAAGWLETQPNKTEAYRRIERKYGKRFVDDLRVYVREGRGKAVG